MKSNNKRYTLFREFVRQLRLPGILITVFMTVMSVLIIGSQLDRMLLNNSERRSLDAFEIFSVQFYFSWLIAPILVFIALSFLRKRSSSDFYHSVGTRKSKLFFSSVGAAMYFALLSVSISCAAAILTCYSRPYLFNINYIDVIMYFIGFIVKVILSGAVSALACSLTGTGFTSVTAYISIAYAPYVFLAELGNNLRRYAGTAHCGKFDNIFEKICDLDLLCYFGYDKSPTVRQILFTLLLGVCVFALAISVFKKRRSETAETAAVSSPIRILLSCSLFFIPMCVTVGNRSNIIDYTVTIVLFVLGFGFIIYELGITKKTSTVLTSLPWLGLTYFAAYLPRLTAYIINLIVYA